MRASACIVLIMALVAMAADGGIVRGQAAEPELAEALTGQAALDYRAALLLFDDGDFAGAAFKFKRAFEQSNDARLLWNIATCEKHQRHYAAVLALLERYQRLAPNMSHADREQVAAVLGTIKQLVSRVRVRALQPEVSVFVDDAPRGTTPLLEPLWVDLGKHVFRFTKPGFQDSTVVRELAGGSEITLEVSLQPLASTGQLRVEAQTADMIRVDGKLVGNAPWQGPLPPGVHMLRVTRAGMQPYETEVNVAAGDTRTIYVTLQPASSGVPAWVWVGAGALALGGLATGGYFLLRPTPTAEPIMGTLDTMSLAQ